MASALINLAMTAVFNLCVPAVSDGAREQTFPADQLHPLSQAEKVDLLGDGGFRGEFWQVKTDDGILVVSRENGYCRVISTSGNTEVALDAFDAALQQAGGHEGFPFGAGGATASLSDGWIKLSATRSIVVVFVIGDEYTPGFFVSTFLAHKESGA